jgi:hypothetical protein
MRRSIAIAAAALLGAVSAPLAAQQSAPPAAVTTVQAPAVVARAQALTIQPISIIVGFYSAEYERAVSRSTTLGLGAGYLDGFVGSNDPTDPTYLSVDAKVRYYPGEQPLRGFAIGVTGGYTSVTARDCNYDVNFNCVTRTNHTSGGPSLGFQLDYNWLLGRRQDFVVALGVGGKRLFINDRHGDLTVAYPTARVSVGMAF